MKIRVAVAAVAVATTAYTSPLFAQSIGEKSGINAALGLAPKTTDFVTEVAVSDMFEIESSKLAASKGDAATKAFAEQMIADHTKTSNELKSAVSGNSALPLPSALDSAHQSKLDKLKNMQGADFDAQYRQDQVSAHKDAVSLFRRYASSGDDAKLKEWAAQTLPALQHHQQMAETLSKQQDTGSRALTPGAATPERK